MASLMLQKRKRTYGLLLKWTTTETPGGLAT
jgi:hypothetical protein